MKIDALISRPSAWLAATTGPETEIVISSRIRLARNVRDAAFPGWAGDEETMRLFRRLRDAVRTVSKLRDGVFWEIAALEELDRRLLCERHLISAELAIKKSGSGVAVSSDETVSVMLNEEDHLRLQIMRPGLDLLSMWQVADWLDSEIEALVPFAFSSRLGFLTACPTNVGTGLRASVMLHLPALRLLNEMEPVSKGLDKIGLAVRGLFGEGTEASGNMFQISNQSTLGESEPAIIKRLLQVVEELVEHERNARRRLIEGLADNLRDHIGRAIGVLNYAYLLPSAEALDSLSGLRLGVEMGLLRGVDTVTINEMVMMTQPAHLQKLSAKSLDVAERDRLRARLIREKIAAVTIA